MTAAARVSACSVPYGHGHLMALLAHDRPDLVNHYEAISREVQLQRGLFLLDTLDLKVGQRVVDLGCGTGQLSAAIAESVGHRGEVLGVDSRQMRIERARILSRRNLQFMVGDPSSLDCVRGGSFDVAVSCLHLHWTRNKKEAFSEAYRLLRPGGRLGVLATSSEHTNAYSRARRAVLSRPAYRRFLEDDGGAPFHANAVDYREWISGAGFHIHHLSLWSPPSTRDFISEEEVFAFFEASSFGNFVAHIPKQLQSMALQEIRDEVKKQRTERASIDSPLLLIVAEKPIIRPTA